MASMLQRDCKQIDADFVLQRSGSQLFLLLETTTSPFSDHIPTPQN